MARSLRYGFVAALVLFALVSIYFAASAFWQPRGTLGITTDYNGKIRSVAPGSPAALAGIVRGDRAVLAATPYKMRRYVAGVGAIPPVGQHVVFTLARGNAERAIELVAVRNQLARADRTVLFFQCLAGVVFIVVGATLILLRPSLGTWGFGLYCLIILPTAPSPFLFPIRHGAVALLLGYDVLQIVGVAGLIVFALEFPRPLETPWRSAVRRALPLIFIVLSAMIAWPDIANQLLGWEASVENQILQIVLGLAFLLALAIAWDTYRRIEPGERERLRWVVLGLSIGLVASYVGNTVIYSSLLPIEPAPWLLNFLGALNVLLPLTIAHAVIRKRVLDIDFVISRAIIYTTFTAALVAVFGLCDWAFAHYLEDFRLSVIVNAAISVGMAFAFDAMQGRAEKLIEIVLFHKRFTAQRDLEALARDVRSAGSPETVERALTETAAALLDLTSAAFFLRSDTASFVRTAATGWSDSTCTSIDESNPVVAALRDVDRPLHLHALAREHCDFPQGTSLPLVAIAMSSHSGLHGFVMYGGHARGGDLDSEELKVLDHFVGVCASALNDIQMDRVLAANIVLQARVVQLEASQRGANFMSGGPKGSGAVR